MAVAGICGGDWDRIGDVYTLDRVSALYEAWGRNGPPVYITQAIKAGFKAKDDDSAEMTSAELERFMASMTVNGIG